MLVYDLDATGSVISQINEFNVALSDPEGIAFNSESGRLAIVSGQDIAIYETSGSLVDISSLSNLNPKPVAPQGLVFAPTSDPYDDDIKLSLYIADGMGDNNDSGDDFANGRIYETKINTIDLSCNNLSPIYGSLEDVTITPNSEANFYPDYFTIAAWVKPSLLSNDQYIISTKQGGGYSLGININGGGGVGVLSSRTRVGTSNYTNAYSDTPLEANKLVHVALTYDGLNFTLYVDGVPDGEKVPGAGALKVPTSDFFIGAEI